MSNKSPADQEAQQAIKESKNGDILLAALGVAALAVAIVVILPTNASVGNQIVLSIEGVQLTVKGALLFCGLCALGSSMAAVEGIRRETGVQLRLIFRTGLGWLLIAMLLFTLVYLSIMVSYLTAR